MSRILVAEDDPHILRVISLWMTRNGHELLEARNGLIALELARAEKPDILITDINMPGLDGLELIEQLKQSGDLPSGVIVLTNRWDHREIAEQLAAYGVRLVPKPFSPTKLAGMVERMGEDVASAGS